MKKVILVLVAISVVTLALATTDVKLGLPLAITSAGQSAEVETVNYVADEVGLKYDYCDILSKDEFAAGVGLADAKSGIGKHVTTLSPDPKGTKFQTLILVVGADLKGMGASGLSVDSEVARLKNLIEYAKANGIKIVAVAIGWRDQTRTSRKPERSYDRHGYPFCGYICVHERLKQRRTLLERS